MSLREQRLNLTTSHYMTIDAPEFFSDKAHDAILDPTTGAELFPAELSGPQLLLK